MNDSEEGFQELLVETFTQALMISEADKQKSKNLHMRIKAPLCAHHQLALYQYPKEIDCIGNIATSQRTIPSDISALTCLLKKQQSSSIALCDFFPRNYECVYNKFREKLSFKRDLTLIIRNITRLARNEQARTFDSAYPTSNQELTFSSDFQCGNLHLVFRQRKHNTYYLLLQNDVNTHGFNFWFYFNIRSTAKKKCTFVIANISRAINFEKDISILTYSLPDQKFERNVGFVTGISQFSRCDFEQNYWSLIFQYQFDSNSEVYFSLTLPYSYSKLIKCLKDIPISQIGSRFESNVKSPLGNIIPIIKFAKEHRNDRRIILITARQHPSETVSSFVCESIIKILSQKSELSDALLQRFRFIILPMVNVDGVIHGNSRTNLMGYDLNRCWDRAGITQSIECQQIWKYLQSIQGGNKMIWSLDLHGHSRQPGFFAFFSDRNQKNLIMAHHLSTKSTIFRQDKCSYEIGFNKRQSIRGQLHYRMKIKNTATIEISLFGYFDQNKKFIHYQVCHFDQIAHCILESLLQTQKLSEKKILKQSSWQQIIQKMEKTQSLDRDIDSDSNPENDYLKKEERKQVEEETQQKFFKPQPNLSRKSRFQSPKIPFCSQQRKIKTWHNAQSKKCKSQRQSPSPPPIPIKIQVKNNEQQRSRQKRMKIQRNQIYNLTFTNRFLSTRKNNNRSQQIKVHANKITYSPKDQKKNEEQQVKQHYRPNQIQNKLLQSHSQLKKSIDMRKKIRLAFEFRHKTQRSIYISNLMDPITTNQINAIIYPTIKQREKSEYQSNLKSKKQLTKQLRNQSYGICLQNRFQNSFYLKGKHE